MLDYIWKDHVWNDLIGRFDGPLSFRLIIQPIVAVVLAIRDGIKDAKAGRPPHFMAIATDPTHRRGLLQETWKQIRNVFIMAVVIDVVYEFIAFRWIYPFQPLLVALVLAVIPYLLIRGPVNRIATRRYKSTAPEKKRDAA
jgi:hypothetical protein